MNASNKSTHVRLFRMTLAKTPLKRNVVNESISKALCTYQTQYPPNTTGNLQTHINYNDIHPL